MKYTNDWLHWRKKKIHNERLYEKDRTIEKLKGMIDSPKEKDPREPHVQLEAVLQFKGKSC